LCSFRIRECGNLYSGKIHQLGGKVVAVSDSNGYVYDQKGIDLDLLKQLKEIERRRIKDYTLYHRDAVYKENGNIWEIPCQIAMPCATEMNLINRMLKCL